MHRTRGTAGLGVMAPLVLSALGALGILETPPEAHWTLRTRPASERIDARLAAQPAAAPGADWRSYAGDLRNHHYSPLDQITAANFNTLEIVWRFKTDNLGPRPEFKLEGTPVVANGVLYTTAGTRRSVVSLDAATGELRWVHSEREGARAAASPRQLSGRGLAYWTDGHEERVL